MTRSAWLIVVGLGIGCGGDTTPKDTVSGPDTDTPGDTDTDTDADSDADADTDADADADTDSDTDADTADTADTGGLTVPQPLRMTFGFQMGYNPATGTAASVFLDLGTGLIEIVPTLELHIGALAWGGDPSQTDQYCTIIFPLDDAPYDAGLHLADVRHLSAFAHDPVANGVVDDCFDGVPADLDPLIFPADWSTQVMDEGPWGVAIGEIDAGTYGYINYLFPTGDLTVDHLVGGSVRHGALFVPTDVPEVWGFAWQVNANNVALLDANYYLTPTDFVDIDQGGGVIAQAWYNIDSLFIYDVL